MSLSIIHSFTQSLHTFLLRTYYTPTILDRMSGMDTDQDKSPDLKLLSSKRDRPQMS